MEYNKSECREARSGLTAPSPCEDVLEDNYLVLGDLGEGSFAYVKLARHILTGTLVAVKVVSNNYPFLREEIAVMKTLEHPHVVQLFEVIEAAGCTCLVMEHVSGGSLSSLGGSMEEDEVWRVFLQVVSAVSYCHEQGIVHRDLKPGNILLDAEGRAKVVDFGLSGRFGPGRTMNEFCGTRRFCAPEILLNQEYGPEVDLWSLGVVLYFMLTGGLPFKAPTAQEQLDQMLEQSYSVPPHVSAPARTLIRRLLTVCPVLRPSAAQVLERWWAKAGRGPPPPTPRVPRRPNPALLRVMQHLGFDRRQAWLSVVSRTFDHAMATYLILERQVSRGAGPEPRGVAPPPSPAHPSAFPPPPRRAASQPDLHRRAAPSEDTLGRQEGGRGASLPAIGSLAKRTPPPSAAPQHVPEAPQDSPGQSSSAQPPRPEPAASAPDGRKSWRLAARKLCASILRRCCCCLLGPGAHRVAPAGGGQRRPTFRNKVAPK